MTQFNVTPYCSDLVFPEGPRWHDGRLWVADMEDQCIKVVTAPGDAEVLLRWSHYPSGLGWLPNGDLLFVSVQEQKIYRVGTNAEPQVHADLGGVAKSFANDMVVDDVGRCYVGSMGFNVWSDEEPKPGTVAVVEPDGSVRLGADEMMFPNGSVITGDGKMLIVAESFSQQLTAFSVDADGSLSNRRCWAKTGDASPDGISMDSHGGIWVASPLTGEVLRFVEGGEMTARIPMSDGVAPFALMLGGADGRQLFIMASSPMGDIQEDRLRTRPGQVLCVEVEHPKSGLP